ncbi:60S ribosomal protein L5 [Perkinsus olseni]|uniref:60S ribosomal protein L5 n=3 Tax=Perkinsus olseni TaxID=32597 RepID=A0A7J6LDM7_PEROL|nr:60S ribosomal protein L5 [Perkinsus olseni]KAF4675723.1 60S ribosomal protein L5 [Perkinsus olseni]KAF4687044.1 60S ribosomal protein L5 [Perkinsus olseni]
MAFVKVYKNKAYHKRYQTKYRRRREGKTDYFQRRRMVKQDKNKYNTPKYRLVVRISNTKVICQIIYATITGDRVLAAAESTELKNYGITVGLKNYAAAYATGLLVARRTLKKLGLDSTFEGQKEIDGEEYYVADEEYEGEKRPFKCVLDVGLVRTTVGARVFGAMKGAADGGLDIPHNPKRFPGYEAPEDGKGEGEYDAEVHRDRIFGNHIAEYMTQMQEDEPEEYEKHFATYIKAGLNADNLEEAYTKCHAAIRANPDPAPKKEAHPGVVRKGNTVITPSGKNYTRSKRLNLKQRKQRVYEKIRVARARAMEE